MSNTSKHTHMTIDMTTDNCMPTANCKHNNERWKRKAIARESHESAIKLRLHKSKSLIGKLGNCNSRCVVSAARAQQCSRIYSLFSSLTSPAELHGNWQCFAMQHCFFFCFLFCNFCFVNVNSMLAHRHGHRALCWRCKRHAMVAAIYIYCVSVVCLDIFMAPKCKISQTLAQVHKHIVVCICVYCMQQIYNVALCS